MKGAQMVTPELVNDLKVLACFEPGNHEQGIKVHSDSDPDLQAAAKRLFSKGLTTRDDGGYLTDRGVTAVEGLESLLSTIK